MNIFSFDPADHRDHYAEHGWVHVRGGIDARFLEELRDFAQRSFTDHVVEGRAIGGRKAQALFEPPADADFPGELFDSISALCGMPRASMTLSERHIKAYDADAPADPKPHKDRFASEASIGLSIVVPEGSHLVLYPYDETEPNPLNVSAAYLEGLPPERRPEVALSGAREVIIEDAPGDVMVFRGSAIWHMRRHAAGAVNLYLKLNSFDCDPLGEDPATAPRRAATLAAVADDTSPIDDLVVVMGRRLDTISRDYARGWHEVVQARVWDAPPAILDEDDLALLREIDGSKTVGQTVGGNGARGEGATAALRRLARTGVVDLVRP
jgi:hypothetical protein